MQDAPSAAAQPFEHEAPGIAKRPAPVEDDANPAAKKRARRLFGALMGTLAKARCGQRTRQLYFGTYSPWHLANKMLGD